MSGGDIIRLQAQLDVIAEDLAKSIQRDGQLRARVDVLEARIAALEEAATRPAKVKGNT